jgi:ribose transport system substrate-binding protein
MKRREILAGLATIGVVGALTGGKSTAAQSGKKYTIAFSHPVSEAPIVTAVRRFANERAAELEVTMVYDNTKSGQIESQVATIETWITQGVDAICVLPLVPSALVQVQKKAQAKGILWTTYALAMDGQDGAVSWDNSKSGQIIGEHCANWIKNNSPEAEALVLTLRAIPGLSGRTDEPLKIFKAMSNVNVVATQDAADPAKGLRVTEDTLQAHPKLNVVIGLNDDGAMGAKRAFENAKRDPAKCYIGGQDGSLDALMAIKKGGFYKSSSALNIRDVGRGIVDLNHGLLAGTGGKLVDIPVVLASLDDLKLLDSLISHWQTT